MSHRPVISLQEYVRLIAEKLTEHPLYHDGMRVSLESDGEGGGSVLFLEDSESPVTKSAFAWAQTQVDFLYRLEDRNFDGPFD